MKVQNLIKQKITIAEKRILELTQSNDLKKLSEIEKHQIADFYQEKSRNRLETAKLIYNASKEESGKRMLKVGRGYKDYAEVVAAAYYSMYYILHAFLALKYKTKLREGLSLLREMFTYNVTSNVEEYHAKQAIGTAEEFINTIRQVMIQK